MQRVIDSYFQALDDCGILVDESVERELLKMIGSALAEVTALGLRSKTGKRLTQETVGKVLTNRLYAGEIFVAKWGSSVKGDFKPLVSRTVFDRVQAVLEGRAAKPARRAKREESFPLRGSLFCIECSKPVTASASTGKMGVKYSFYRCHRVNGHMNERAETVENAFTCLLEQLTPKSERMRLIEGLFRDVWSSKLSHAEVEWGLLRKELTKLEAKKSRLLEQMVEGNIGGEDFKSVIGILREKALKKPPPALSCLA